MKLIVFGATGKTGRHVCRRALAPGPRRHRLRALGGEAGRGDSGVRVVQGDVTDVGSDASAVAGQDAAISPGRSEAVS